MSATRSIGPRVLSALSFSIGGGSLIVFTYFLLIGAPFEVIRFDSQITGLIWDASLCLLFFLQHSGMIRRGAKESIARRVPSGYYPALYSIVSGIALFAVVLLWQPTQDFIYLLHGPARWVATCVFLSALGGFAWGARSLRAFDPFGTLSIKAHLRGTTPRSSEFVIRGPYRWVRHPLYLFVLLLIWSAPRLSTDRLLFNVLWTAWIVVGTKLEERDLVGVFGDAYRRYQATVPMLIPFPFVHGRHKGVTPAA